MFKKIFLIGLLVATSLLHSQENNDEDKAKIATAFEDYFNLEREAIHLHLDKSTFLTHEKIWYQGYIINRKTKKQFFTSNVYVTLYDEKGIQMKEKLLFAYNGVFSGVMDLDKSMHSGIYYLQVHTNWMNNFSEDESAVFKINVINPTEGVKNFNKVNPESLELFLNPEGGTYINGIKNTIGISAKDCRNNAPENLEVAVRNSKDEIIKTVLLNTAGFGKIEINPEDDFEKITATYQDKTLSKSITNRESIGFGLEVNNYSLKEKTILKIKTNPTTVNALKNQKLYLVVHQDSHLFIHDFGIDQNKLEQIIALQNSDLMSGINTIRIIDSNQKEWAHRLFYNPQKKDASIDLSKNYRNEDQIGFVGRFPNPNTIISISILPTDTKSTTENYSIVAGLGINPYLVEQLQNANYYLLEQKRTNDYELDLFLINQAKLKYEWETIKSIKPEANFSFDIGLILKGNIPSNIKNKTDHKVKIVSYKDLIIKSTDVNENGEYAFENLILTDSTNVTLSVLKLPNFEEVEGKINYQLLNRKKPFYKAFKPKPSCFDVMAEELLSDVELPKFTEKAIELEEVIIEKKLTYQKAMGNAFLRGHKVDETLENIDLLSFIERNGFIVQRSFGEVAIYSRINNSMNSARPTPQIIIDGRVVMDQLEFTSMRMIDFEEIYLSPNAIVAGMQNFSGIIKAYTKKTFKPNRIKDNPNTVMLKEAFSSYPSFSNANYQSTQNSGFDYYGLIEWKPLLCVNDEDQFLFRVTDYNKPQVKVIIEGITPEGQLIHEEILMDMK